MSREVKGDLKIGRDLSVGRNLDITSASSPLFTMIDLAGSLNDKTIRAVVASGIQKWYSVDDIDATRIDNILVVNLGTGNIGIGVVPAASGLNALRIGLSGPVAGDTEKFTVQNIPTPGTADTVAGFKLYLNSDVANTADMSAIYGITKRQISANTGDTAGLWSAAELVNLIHVPVTVTYTNSTAVMGISNLTLDGIVLDDIGTIAILNAAALYIKANSVAGITNKYGLKIGDVTSGTNNWAIYTGLGKVRFGGDLEVIGSTTLATTLTGPLHATAGLVSASAISLTADVSGVLPIANGGTNSNSALANLKLMYSAAGKIVESGIGCDASWNLTAVNTIAVGDGAVGAPSLFFTSSSTTGIYRIGANNLGFAAAGVAVGNISAAGLWTIGANAGTQIHVVNGTLSTTYNHLILGGTQGAFGLNIGTTDGGSGSTSQYGIYNQFTGNSSGTVAIIGYSARATSTAAAYTCTSRIGFASANVAKGAGSTITNDLAFYAVMPTQGDTGNAILSDSLTPGVSYGIYLVTTNPNYFAGQVRVGDELRLMTSGSLTRYTGSNYIDSITLTGSTTAVVSNFTFDTKVIKAKQIDYTIVEGDKRRFGALKITVDKASGVTGTTPTFVDSFTQTADVGVTWAVAMNGDNCELSYTTTANNKTMRSYVRIFLA